MAKPKLALIPATQGSKLYSVLPADGVGDFNFSRNTAATRINKDGLIETVAVGKSRLNYPLIDGKVVGCPSHLLEPQRTNLFSYSEDFNSGSPNWDLYGGATVTSNNAISPDGTLNADKLSDVGGIYSQRPYTQNTDYTFSLFVKKSTATGLHMNFVDQGAGYLGGTIVYTYSTNSIEITQSANSSISAESLDYGNGWIRLIMKFTTNVAQNYNYQSIESIGGDSFIYGAQLEQGSYATSYIPTSGSAVTRVAETANGAGDASTFNDSEGVLMVESSTLVDGESVRVIGLSDGSTNNRISITYHSTLNRIQIFGSKAGDEIFNLEYLNSEKTNLNKVAVKYSASLIEFYYNGFLVDSVVPTDIFNTNTLDRLNFNRITGGNDFYGNVKQLQYFDSALNDSDLEKITSWTSFTDLANGQTYSIK